MLMFPGIALAGAPTLQVTPLQYEDTLSGATKNGHIDVANPSDSPVTVEASVRRFTQTGTNGDLTFSDDADLARAIKLDLASFQLQPHDAIRVLFSVDPSKLPAGGTYAAIFFRTIPSDNPDSGSSYVAQSANIGTLLILTNGAAAASGGVSSLNLPFWQFGAGITGSTLVANTSPPRGGVAFRPALTTRVLPWGRASGQAAGLVLPGSQRRFTVSRPGSFFGLLAVTITDGATHTSRTAWILACTGWSGWVVLVLLLTALVLIVLRPIKRPMRLRLRLPDRVSVLEPLADAIAEVGEPQPTPEPEPELPTNPKPNEPLPAANPKVTKLIVQAEAAAPSPGTVIQPKPDEARPAAATPKKRRHKVSVNTEEKSKPVPIKRQSKSKPAHKIKIKRDARSVKPRSK